MKSLTFLASLVALAGAAHAQTIFVPNFDFATNPGHSGVADVSDTAAIQYFTESSTGAGHYGNAGVPAPDGSTSGFINTDNAGTITLTNDLTAGSTLTAPTFVAGTTYTLNLEVGVNPTNSNQSYDRPGNVTFGLTVAGTGVGTFTSVPAGTVPIQQSGGSPTFSFEDFTYTYTATSSDAGKAIGIEIVDQYPEASQTEFSDLTLTTPEPKTWAMLLGGLGVLAFGLRLRSLRTR